MLDACLTLKAHADPDVSFELAASDGHHMVTSWITASLRCLDAEHCGAVNAEGHRP